MYHDIFVAANALAARLHSSPAFVEGWNKLEDVILSLSDWHLLRLFDACHELAKHDFEAACIVFSMIPPERVGARIPDMV